MDGLTRMDIVMVTRAYYADGVCYIDKCGCEWAQEWCGDWGNMRNARLAMVQSCANHLHLVGSYRYYNG